MRHQTNRSIIAGTAIALTGVLGVDNGAHADSPVLHAPPSGYAWQISAEDEVQLYGRVETLRYGDPLVRVRAVLGAPTREEDAADKKGEHRAKILVYAIRRVRPEGGNMYDQEIELIFGDQNHRLLEIWFTNMSPLSGEITEIVKIPGTTEIYSYFTRPPAP